jgi:hypothetical protein
MRRCRRASCETGGKVFQIFSQKDSTATSTPSPGLSPEHPVEVLLDPKQDGTLDCTVLAFDYPGEFSIITGVLAAQGLTSIQGMFSPTRAFPARSPPAGEFRKRRGKDELLQAKKDHRSFFRRLWKHPAF